MYVAADVGFCAPLLVLDSAMMVASGTDRGRGSWAVESMLSVDMVGKSWVLLYRTISFSSSIYRKGMI